MNSNFKKVFNNVISKLSSIHESKDSVLRIIAENFDYLNNEEKQILLNDSNGKLLLFYYKMLQGPLGMGDYTRNVLGIEGLFLFQVYNSDVANNNLLNLFLEVNHWAPISEYIAFIEERTEINYTEYFVDKICNVLRIHEGN